MFPSCRYFKNIFWIVKSVLCIIRFCTVFCYEAENFISGSVRQEVGDLCIVYGRILVGFDHAPGAVFIFFHREAYVCIFFGAFPQTEGIYFSSEVIENICLFKIIFGSTENGAGCIIYKIYIVIVFLHYIEVFVCRRGISYKKLIRRIVCVYCQCDRIVKAIFRRIGVVKNFDCGKITEV